MTDIATYDIMYLSTDNDNCCLMTAFTAPSNNGPMAMFSISDNDGVSCNNEQFMVVNDTNNVYFMDMIELSMMNDEENIYIELMMDTNTTKTDHMIQGQSIIFNYTNQVCNIMMTDDPMTLQIGQAAYDR